MKNQSKPKFNPTPEMITATKNLLMAKAIVQTIRPIVEGYQKAILGKHKFTNKEEMAMITKINEENNKSLKVEEKIILDPSNTYLLSEEDFNIYWLECKAERDRLNLKVEKDDFCPLLVAENLEIEANRDLLIAMMPISGINPDDLWDLDKKKQLIELSLKLMVAYCSEKGINLNLFEAIGIQ